MSEEKPKKASEPESSSETTESTQSPSENIEGTTESTTEPSTENKELEPQPEPEETISEKIDSPPPEPRESVTITKSNYNKMIAGIVAVVAVAAFFGGYSIGTLDTTETVTKDEIAGMLADLQAERPVETQQAPSEPTPVFVSLDDDPVKGDPDAPVTIVEFSDFQCPFCLRFYAETLPLLEENYIKTGKAKLVYRDMPLQIHPNAFPVHMAAECAGDQGAYWEYHDILFERQGEWNRLSPGDLSAKIMAYAEELELDSSFATCMQDQSTSDEIRKDYSQGAGYGVTGTPSFFVGNDKDGYIKLSGAQPFSTFQAVIDEQLG